jgi:hypothetical protein
VCVAVVRLLVVYTRAHALKTGSITPLVLVTVRSLSLYWFALSVRDASVPSNNQKTSGLALSRRLVLLSHNRCHSIGLKNWRIPPSPPTRARFRADPPPCSDTGLVSALPPPPPAPCSPGLSTPPLATTPAPSRTARRSRSPTRIRRAITLVGLGFGRLPPGPGLSRNPRHHISPP